MSKKTSYVDEQMIHTLSKNGESKSAIANAMDIPRTTVRVVLDREPSQSYNPEIIGDGCSYMTDGGSMPQDKDALTPLDIEDMELEVSDHTNGQLTKLESGYPDIYYNERSKQWEVWKGNSRIWRSTKLSEACKVRLSKGSLSATDEQLLQSVVDAPKEVQDALNEMPI